VRELDARANREDRSLDAIVVSVGSSGGVRKIVGIVCWVGEMCSARYGELVVFVRSCGSDGRRRSRELELWDT
jgi:hypothetical protein